MNKTACRIHPIVETVTPSSRILRRVAPTTSTIAPDVFIGDPISPPVSQATDKEVRNRNKGADMTAGNCHAPHREHVLAKCNTRQKSSSVAKEVKSSWAPKPRGSPSSYPNKKRNIALNSEASPRKAKIILQNSCSHEVESKNDSIGDSRFFWIPNLSAYSNLGVSTAIHNSLNSQQRNRNVSRRVCRDCVNSSYSPPTSLLSTRTQRSSSHHPAKRWPSSFKSLPMTTFLLGLILCVIQAESVKTRSAQPPASVCGQIFTDPRSSALMADLVIEGKVRKTLRVNPATGYFDVFISTRKKILKGAKIFKNKMPKRITVGRFKEGPPDKENCVANVRKGRTYIFYLRSNKGLRFEITAMPTKRTKKLLRDLKNILCKKCGFGKYKNTYKIY
ncbi:hypothetical protein PoB_005203100 [Plakobranchus ocellatus]|uniref:NTR domain-containing protein n=1 Tax=Plakobranchus ocellatus TaxID=259542 RepID=A0AAV4BQK5_9GAST|nr:hypothetical protein PoB_005203100 [Plakobranchus ocellatus]